MHKILLTKQECYLLAAGHKSLITIHAHKKYNKTGKAKVLHICALHKLKAAGVGFCNESYLKHWDLKFQQLIWKRLLKTPKQSISAMILINSIILHTPSLFCIMKIEGNFKWTGNTLCLFKLIPIWVCRNYQHTWLNFFTVLRTCLAFSFICYQFCLLICTLQLRKTHNNFTFLTSWAIHTFSFFLVVSTVLSIKIRYNCFFRSQTQTRVISSAILIHQTLIFYRWWKQSYLLDSHLQLKNIRKALIMLASLSESYITGRQVETPPWCSFTQNRVRIWQSSDVSAWKKTRIMLSAWNVLRKMTCYVHFFSIPHYHWVGFFGCFGVFQIDMTNSTSNVEIMLKQKLTSPEDQNQN